MRLRAVHGTDCDLPWYESMADGAERVSMRLAVTFALIAMFVLFPVFLVLAIFFPGRDAYD